jgi:hypothetical protein
MTPKPGQVWRSKSRKRITVTVIGEGRFLNYGGVEERTVVYRSPMTPDLLLSSPVAYFTDFYELKA